MYSLEEIASITGDAFYLDALERMTFNALPSQTTDDYNNKQYFQMANQVNIKRGVFEFSLPFDREMNNVLGAKSGYTCCLANMHQGWTKYSQHLWYKTPGNGLAALVFGPNKCMAKVGASGQSVEITENTTYPFDETVRFELKTGKPVDFRMDVRIPGWCSEATLLVNGEKLRSEKGGQIVSVQRLWKNGDVLTLEFPMDLKVSTWGRNSRAVERGPLVYALKVGERWEKGHDEREGDYFSVYPTSEWNYGLTRKAIEKPAENISFRKVKEVGADFIWNLVHAPIEITAPGKKIPGWTVVNDVATQPVTDRNGIFKGKVDEQTEQLTLVPVGCTKVRIVAFPVVP